MVASSNGKLIVKNGKLLEDCCCDYHDYKCKPCCIYTNQTVYTTTQSGYTLTVEVLGGNEGVFCEDEQVTIRATMATPDNDPLGPNHYPQISWDRLWKYVTHGPSIGADGAVHEQGAVFWGDSTTLVAEVTLRMSPCWSGNINYGDIIVVFEEPLLVVTVDFESCAIGVECCSKPPCEPCCWVLYEDFKEDNGIYEGWDTNDAGWRMRVTASPSKICIYDGASATIKVDIIPPNNEPVGDFELCIEYNNWIYEDHTPDIPGLPDPPPNPICWNDGSLHYELELSLEPCTLPFPIGVQSDLGLAVDIVWEECPNPDDVCCCPEPRCDCKGHCYFPKDVDLCDQFPGRTFKQTGGPTQIVNFKLVADKITPGSGKLPCPGGIHWEVHQVGPSRHELSCGQTCDGKWIQITSLNTFEIPVKTFCDGVPKNNLAIGIQRCSDNNGVTWIPGAQFGISGRLVPGTRVFSSDCNNYSYEADVKRSGGEIIRVKQTFEIIGPKPCSEAESDVKRKT